MNATREISLPFARSSTLHESQITNELDARGYTFAGRTPNYEQLLDQLTETALKDGRSYGVLTAIGGSWVFSLTRDQIGEALRLHR